MPIPPRPRRRRQMTRRWAIGLFVALGAASAGGIVWYGISTGDQPDMTCTGSAKSGTPQPGQCYMTEPPDG